VASTPQSSAPAAPLPPFPLSAAGASSSLPPLPDLQPIVAPGASQPLPPPPLPALPPLPTAPSTGPSVWVLASSESRVSFAEQRRKCLCRLCLPVRCRSKVLWVPYYRFPRCPHCL
jgi:hypothetical protein